MRHQTLFLMLILCISSFAQNIEKLMNTNYWDYAPMDKIRQRINTSVDNELFTYRITGNRNFSEVDIIESTYKIDTKNDTIKTIYSFAFCQNYALKDDRLYPQRAKAGLLKVISGINRGGRRYYRTEWVNSFSYPILNDTAISTINNSIIELTSNQKELNTLSILNTLSQKTKNQAHEYFIKEGYMTGQVLLKELYNRNGKDFILIDYVQFLSGKEGAKAMLEDGAKEVDMPDNYYIRNQYKRTKEFEINENSRIILLYGGRPDTTSIEEFKVAKVDSRNKYKFEYFLAGITTKKNLVVQLSETYTP